MSDFLIGILKILWVVVVFWVVLVASVVLAVLALAMAQWMILQLFLAV